MPSPPEEPPKKLLDKTFSKAYIKIKPNPINQLCHTFVAYLTVRQWSSMPTLADRFLTLPTELRKAVHIDLCRDALRVWTEYCRAHKRLDYVETVCGTKQKVDRALPEAAIRSVVAGKDIESVSDRYQEPIAAMQDDDLEFPDDVEFAYYAIYNLFNRYVGGRLDDDWLIVNQALSAHGKSADYATILESTMKRIGEPDAAPNSRPPSQSPSSSEVQSSDSQRTPFSGGCG